MNLFQLVLKQMRQRALGTALTLLSVMLGVALAVSVLLMKRESGRLFGQTDFGYEILVGPPKGSGLQLVLNTVYQVGLSEGNVPYDVYEDLAARDRVPGRAYYRPFVRLAVPIMVGDSYNGRRIVGTTPALFGFDDDARPFKGYDDKGRRLPQFADPNTTDEDVPDEKKAAAVMEYRRGRKYTLAQGGSFRARRFEAVIGSDVAREEKLGVGSRFKATHGFPGPNDTPDVHELEWTVVGILEPTHTANDRVLFVPLVSLYAIEEHSFGLIQQAMIRAGISPNAVPPEQLPAVLEKLGFDPDDLPDSVMRKFRIPKTAPAGGGDLLKPTTPTPAPAGDLLKDVTPPAATKPDEHDDHDADHDHEHEEHAFHFDEKGDIVPDLPKDEWQVSAIYVKTRPYQASQLLYQFKVGRPDAVAVSPSQEMAQFFSTFMKGSILLLVALAALVSVVAAISILVSIYNSVAARQKEIAILRALGATKARVLTLICVEAGLIGLIGGVLGLVAGHALAGAGSVFFERTAGESIDWVTPSAEELQYLAVVVVIALLAGLVPALKAYRTPVATNLVAS
jgi:putative ABC transport system permease protein